ncbi:MAG: HlyD family efflux transporter periplasmic adaptor subunit [Candidatus Paceibacterota bacterium]
MLHRLYSWYGKKNVLIVAAAIVALLIIGVVLHLRGDTAEEVEESMFPVVYTAPAGVLAEGDTASFVGSVRAVSEAEIETERAGRVTSVPVELGAYVTAGSVIATLENSAEQAAVLQAQGAYEAALAAASQSDVSVSSAENAVNVAENNLIASYNTLYTTSNDVLRTTIDDFFSNPNGSLPGLYINGRGQTSFVNGERVAFQDIMSNWQARSTALQTTAEFDTSVTEAGVWSVRLMNLIDTFITLVNDQEHDQTVGGVAVESYNAILIADRAAIDGALTALKSNLANYKTAEENLEKARISGTEGNVSAANAQVKQALGSLRAAQANLSKTIMRTPIAGTINSLSVNVSDYLGVFSPVAKVANNNALEISVFLGESDLDRVTVGSEVLIEGEYTGTVTHIGAGIDSTTQKTEVKIATEAQTLTNGDTVTVTLTESSTVETPTNSLFIPLAAVKLQATDGTVFAVEDGHLVAVPVVLGSIRGTSVEIISGIERSQAIVTDARGLVAGDQVEAVNKN